MLGSSDGFVESLLRFLDWDIHASGTGLDCFEDRNGGEDGGVGEDSTSSDDGWTEFDGIGLEEFGTGLKKFWIVPRFGFGRGEDESRGS